MSILTLIIKREFVAKVRNKSFIVMTFLSPLLFVGIAIFIGYLSSLQADPKTIAIHDETGLFSGDFKPDEEVRYTDMSKVPVQVLKDSLISEHYNGILIIPKTADNSQLQKSIQYVSNESPSLEFVDRMEAVIAKRLTLDNYVRAGMDSVSIRKAQANVQINLKKSTGEDTLKGLNWVKTIIGGSFGYLIMMFIIIYGNMVMRSVIEEKTNRIIEIIISSVKPFQLMMGKIIGTSLAGILQFLVWAILGSILFMLIGSFLGPESTDTAALSQSGMADPQQHIDGSIQLYIKEIMALPLLTLVVSFVVYFIGGYFLYSSFYAAIGAAVDNETDSQQFLLPIIMPLIIGVYIGFFTVMNDPHGTVATVFSFFPLTSPIVMLMRIPFGVPWYQIILSILLLFATFYFVVWFAAKIYRVGILMYGKKPTWRELGKWLKY